MQRFFALLLGLVVAGLSSGADAETLRVAVAQRGFWNSTFVDIAEKQGFFKAEGLTIEVLYTEGGASTLTPLIAGSIDVAMSNGILGVIAAYAKGAPVRIITSEATGAAEAFWYARTESGIKSLKDTNGKTVAFSSPGSSTNLVLLQLIKAAGATPKMVPTGGLPATYTQVMTGQIDVGWAVPPFALKDLQEKKIQIIARGSDVAEVQGADHPRQCRQCQYAEDQARRLQEIHPCAQPRHRLGLFQPRCAAELRGDRQGAGRAGQDHAR